MLVVLDNCEHLLDACAVLVCSGPALNAEDVLDVLARLTRKSLLVSDEAADGTGRFRLLETVREYAREKLSRRGVAEVARLRSQYAEFYTRLAEQHDPWAVDVTPLIGAQSNVSGAHIASTVAENDNFLAALAWWLEAGRATEGLRLANARRVATVALERPAVLMVFDLLRLASVSWVSEPLVARRSELARLLDHRDPCYQFLPDDVCAAPTRKALAATGLRINVKIVAARGHVARQRKPVAPRADLLRASCGIRPDVARHGYLDSRGERQDVNDQHHVDPRREVCGSTSLHSNRDDKPCCAETGATQHRVSLG